MKNKYTIQISQSMTVSREIQADSIKDAFEKAKDIIEAEQQVVKPIKGWTEEWTNETSIAGVFS